MIAVGAAAGTQAFLAPPSTDVAIAEPIAFTGLSEPVTAVLVANGKPAAHISLFVSFRGKTDSVLPARAQIAAVLARLLRKEPFDLSAHDTDDDGLSETLARHLEGMLSKASLLEGMTIRIDKAFAFPIGRS